MAKGSSKPLWQHGLDWLRSTDPSTHASDRDRCFELAQGLRKLGELPPYRVAVSKYVGQLWDDSQKISMVRDCWLSVQSAKTSRGRPRHAHSAPLSVPDMLIREHRLRPSAEDRLAAVARDAVDALLAATARNASSRSYRARKAELTAAMAAVDELRALRERDAHRARA